MSQALQIIDELEVALKSNSTERHHAILKSVTGLFLVGCDRMTEEITSLFDDVIVRLVDHVESRARVELSRDVAPIANAPHNVIHHLADDDDITVAGPVLAQSPRLTDQNLVEIAESKGQSHLSKIAERRQLSPVVTDVLVDRGDREIVTKVAGNSGARLSKTGMSMLTMRASGDNDLTEAMTRRVDISPALFKRLLSHATEEARAGIARDLGDDLAVAAIDQHVGDHRAELPALGDLAQVRLALALGDLDQILVGQPRRLRQHRPGDGDVIVAGEAMDDIMRSIGDRRDVPAQLDPRAAFDMIDQADDDVVEQRGYILGHPVAAGQEQAGDALQDRVVAFG